MRDSGRSIPKRVALLLLSVGVLWGPLMVYPSAWLGLLLVICAVLAVWLLLPRWYVIIGLIWLLSPITLSAGAGAWSYFAGHPTMQYMGLFGPEFHGSIDPDLRCARRTGGCLVGGHEWLTNGTHNAVTRFLIHTLGPAEGSYTGPYPTEEEALDALSDAAFVSHERIAADDVPIGDRIVKLDGGVGRKLLADAWQFYEPEAWQYSLGEHLSDDPDPLKSPGCWATVWKDRCLILRIDCRAPAFVLDSHVEDWGAVIAVIDTETGRPFAYYTQENYRGRFYPRVSWYGG